MEGKDLILEWTYTLDGTLLLSQYFNVSDSGLPELIAKGVGPGNMTSEQKFQARFKAKATNTRAELTILAVQRSDQSTYRVDVAPTGAGTLTYDVDVIVQCKYRLNEILLVV